MVEGAALEMLYRGNSIVGSNPTLSAIFMPKNGHSSPFLPHFSLKNRLRSCILCRNQPCRLDNYDHESPKKRTHPTNERNTRQTKAKAPRRPVFLQHIIVNITFICVFSFQYSAHLHETGNDMLLSLFKSSSISILDSRIPPIR